MCTLSYIYFVVLPFHIVIVVDVVVGLLVLGLQMGYPQRWSQEFCLEGANQVDLLKIILRYDIKYVANGKKKM